MAGSVGTVAGSVAGTTEQCTTYNGQLWPYLGTSRGSRYKGERGSSRGELLLENVHWHARLSTTAVTMHALVLHSFCLIVDRNALPEPFLTKTGQNCNTMNLKERKSLEFHLNSF